MRRAGIGKQLGNATLCQEGRENAGLVIASLMGGKNQTLVRFCTHRSKKHEK